MFLIVIFRENLNVERVECPEKVILSSTPKVCRVTPRMLCQKNAEVVRYNQVKGELPNTEGFSTAALLSYEHVRVVQQTTRDHTH